MGLSSVMVHIPSCCVSAFFLMHSLLTACVL